MSLSKGIWSNFAKRSPSLSVKSSAVRSALLSPSLQQGPVSLRKPSSKRRYESPIGMEDVYPLAYEILEKEAEGLYAKVDELQTKLAKTTQEEEQKSIKSTIEELVIRAEKFNPTVLYNARYASNSLDLTHPVYRYYAKQKWESFSKMVTMQRLETMSVIPDTLPTLDPKVDVKLKFPHNNVEKWIEPGEILSSNVTSKPPAFEITEFEEVTETDTALYSVLIVNPDVPELETDSFSTTLQWGLQDIKLTNTARDITPLMVEQNPSLQFIDYLPATPEKNAPTNRLAVWVFKQTKPLNLAMGSIQREKFDIRQFVEEHGLTPIGAHVYRSVWDRNVNNVRELYGSPKGRIFHRVRR